MCSCVYIERGGKRIQRSDVVKEGRRVGGRDRGQDEGKSREKEQRQLSELYC